MDGKEVVTLSFELFPWLPPSYNRTSTPVAALIVRSMINCLPAPNQSSPGLFRALAGQAPRHAGEHVIFAAIRILTSNR
jgi:hypothetical protein